MSELRSFNVSSPKPMVNPVTNQLANNGTDYAVVTPPNVHITPPFPPVTPVTIPSGSGK